MQQLTQCLMVVPLDCRLTEPWASPKESRCLQGMLENLKDVLQLHKMVERHKYKNEQTPKH